MNRTITKMMIMVISVLVGFVANAQNFRFGINGDVLLSWLVSDDDGVESKGMAPGFSYGLWAEYFFASNYGFTSGLRVSHMGGFITYNNDGFYIRLKEDTVIALPGTGLRYSLQYVEIPLSLKFKTNEIGYFTYFGQFGFISGILWRAKARTDNIPGFEEYKRIYDMNFFNASLLVGLGLEYNLAGNTSLLVRLSYVGGFTDITKHKRILEDKDNAAVRINSVRLAIGFLF
ncbi:MAG: PorT family protein [Chlorobi bacterium]|nr:PorT family protein [Chlorobiota bacterium]